MKYLEKVKKCAPFFIMVKSLKEDQEMSFAYKGNRFKLKAYRSYNGEMSYSVWGKMRGMNVSNIGVTSITLYDFNMMSQKTVYRMNILDCLEEGEISVITPKQKLKVIDEDGVLV